MYEGITSDILSKSVFEGLDLRIITNSFIEGCDSEFDVMLVRGHGRKIPFTKGQYIYELEKVITVFQVKKNLYKKDLEDSFDNLNSLVLSTQSVMKKSFHDKIIRDSFQMICGKKIISEEDFNMLNDVESNVFEMLCLDALLPRRIVLGYNGFKSEFSLREKMYEYLTSKILNGKKKIGYAPVNFPDLIISDNFSLVKINGMPYSTKLIDNNEWPFYASSSYNPMRIMLEVIWTRLSYMYDEITHDIFGEDLTHDPMTVFLTTNTETIGDTKAWYYDYLFLSKKFLQEKTMSKKWEPVYLDMPQFVIIGELCKKEEVSIDNNSDLEKYVQDYGYFGIDDFITNFKRTHLVWITNNNTIRLLTEKCQCAILPNGQLVAAENKTGRLNRWILKNKEKN